MILGAGKFLECLKVFVLPTEAIITLHPRVAAVSVLKTPIRLPLSYTDPLVDTPHIMMSVAVPILSIPSLFLSKS